VTGNTNFYVGASYAGTNLWNGTIHSIKIFSGKLDDQECLDYSNGGGFWNYMNEASNYWPLDMKNLLVDVKGGNNGTAVGNAVKNTTKAGYAFDGTGDYISCASPLTIGTNDYSCVALVRKSSVSPSSYGSVLGSSTGSHSILSFIESNSTLQLRMSGQISVTGAEYTAGNNVWQVLGVSVDRSGLAYFYVNGRFLASSSVAATVAYNFIIDPLYISRIQTNIDFKGDMAHIMFWNGKLLSRTQHFDAYLKLQQFIDQP
jgi:hypothetical protein